MLNICLISKYPDSNILAENFLVICHLVPSVVDMDFCAVSSGIRVISLKHIRLSLVELFGQE